MGNRRRRTVVLVVNAIAALVCLVAVTGAFAKVTPSVITTLTLDQVIPTGSSGATTTIQVPATQLGQHADLTVSMSFGYGATESISDPAGNYEDPATYPAPSSQAESLDHLVVTTPPGLVGNPNAVPVGDRCDISTFETSVCAPAATVGDFGIKTLLLNGTKDDLEATPEVPGDGGLVIPIGLGKNIAGSYTRVSLLKTDPEVPALIGILVQPPFNFAPIRTLMKVYPDTQGDLRLVTITPDGIADQLGAGPSSTDPVPGTPLANFRVDFMKLRLYGRLRTNGHAFMTNPTSCTAWNSQIWANAHEYNDNADSDPLRTGTNNYKAGNTSSITPDCTNQTNVPFPITGKVAISTPARDTSPDFNFTIDDPGVQADADGAVATSPKKIVTTIPASLNVDVQQLGRTCTVPDFNADHCPATSRVGSVQIKTPLLIAGLSGDVYLVKEKPSGLPDLGLRVRGAITFSQRGSNRYVGPNFNQIETTFDDIPQIGFSELSFHLDGGTNGLLRSLSCPVGNKQPAAGSFNYTFTGYTGQSVSSSAPLNLSNCFGIQKLRSFKCVYRVLRFQPTYTSRARLKRVTLKVDKRRVATAKSGHFGFTVSAKKFKKGRHRIELQARYDDGTLSVKRSTFKKCGRS